jgi:FMN phosphatase YigB (HAD superfamily)
MRPLRAVLFDAGDTLIRLTGAPGELLRRAAQVRGLGPLDAVEAEQVWQRVLERASAPEELGKGRDLSVDKHREVWTQLYEDAGCGRLASGLSEALYDVTVDPASWETFPDVLPVLRSLRDGGVRVGVLSDTGFDLRPVFDALGLSRWIDDVAMSFETGVCKPDRSAFVGACERLGCEPAETLMVGDNPLTDGGAVAAGLPVLLLPPADGDGPRGLERVLPLVASSAQTGRETPGS